MKNFNNELSKEMAQKQEKLEKNELKQAKTVKLPFKRFDKELPALFRESLGNAGFDLFARLDKPVFLEPGEVAVIPLNVATQIPPYAVGLLFQRSSTYRKWKLRLTNGVGVVDSLFHGPNDEWGAEFQNLGDTTAVISNGDKLCQAVFLPLLPVELFEKDEFDTDNRGGFGTSFDNAEKLGTV